MNDYLKAQITNMKTMAETFKHSCYMTALKNDGTVDRDEEKYIKKINAVTDRYIQDLEKIIR